MRFYKQQHAFYCGVDLHARTLYLGVFNQAGDKLLHKEFGELRAKSPARQFSRRSPTPCVVASYSQFISRVVR